MRFKRRDKVQKLIQEQIDLVAQGLGFLKEAVDFYLEGNKQGCELKSRTVEEMETKADEAERVADFLSLENPEIPSRWNRKIREIMEKGILVFTLFRESFMFLYEDTQKAFSHTYKV